MLKRLLEGDCYRLLAIDGGGIKGMVPLTLLSELEKRTGKQSFELFNMVAGTSIGSFVAGGICTPKQNGVPFRAIEVRTLLASMAAEIFPNYPQGVQNKDMAGKVLVSFEQILYREAVGLRGFAQRLVSNAAMRDCIIPTMMTSYDIIRAEPFMMRSWDNSVPDLTVETAMMASGAAPVYLPTVTVNTNTWQEEVYADNKMDEQKALVDGGVLGVNPTLFGLVDMRRRLRDELGVDNPKILVVSMSTGARRKHPPIISPPSVSQFGAQWIIPLVDTLLDGLREITTYTAPELSTYYMRIDTTLEEAVDLIDCVGLPNNADNLDKLVNDATIRAGQEDFQALCDFLGNTAKPEF